MNLDLRTVLRAAAAVAMLAVVATQTLGAVKQYGAWSSKAVSVQRPDDPYLGFEEQLARPEPAIPFAVLRDPFAYASSSRAEGHALAERAMISAPPTPVLTAIIWDNDPRASIQWDGRDYSVRTNSQFADYQVMSIRRDEIVLAQGDQTLVLRIHKKGE